jgi:hypothetical protein
MLLADFVEIDRAISADTPDPIVAHNFVAYGTFRSLMYDWVMHHWAFESLTCAQL